MIHAIHMISLQCTLENVLRNMTVEQEETQNLQEYTFFPECFPRYIIKFD